MRSGIPVRTGYTMQTVHKKLFGYRLWYLVDRHPKDYPLEGFKKVFWRFYWKKKKGEGCD
jgi:hypothetical protein